MITADTITDEQIRELREDTRNTGEIVMNCDIALGVHTPWRPAKEAARARCAEIINARAKEAK